MIYTKEKRMRVKSILILFLSLLLIFTSCSTSENVTENTTIVEETIIEESSDTGLKASVVEISKYGNIYVDALVAEFPFELGDLVTVSANGNEIAAPVVTSYSDVDNGMPLVKIDGENVEIALSYADFANNYGVSLGSEITISLLEEGAYLTEYEIRHLERTDNREDYSSDEVFANFRPLSGGNLKDYFIYRSCNPALGDARSEYADNLAEMVGIQTVINLSNDEEYLLMTIDPNSYYANLYEEGRVVLLNMGVDFRTDDFKAKLKEGLLFMLENPQDPFLIHCNEGKDRAGLVSALLEALGGCSMDEIVADYMTSYENYYGVEEGTERYDAISQIIRDFFTEINGRPFPENAVKTVAENYLISQVGLTADQVAALEALITE